MGIFSNLGVSLKRMFSAPIDDEYFDELEEQLILADVGVRAAGQIVEKLRERVKKEGLRDASQLLPSSAR
jgi:fused signal recognition particle receptor